MGTTYIDRRLIVLRDGQETTVSQAELAKVGYPLIILGDPGIGKTMLTEELASTWGVRRISAGSFCRQPASAFSPTPAALIIDGLDELALTTGLSAVDEVLKKLAVIGYPPFVLSCRAADWNGVADWQKIKEDYGAEPIAARLEPFSKQDATTFLVARGLDANKLIQDLETMDLDDFYGNPLTLSLVAEIVESGAALPTSRADLLQQASELLVQEKNVLHQASVGAKSPVDAMLGSAGAIFAHLLLSGSLGVANMVPPEAPPGFIPISEMVGLKSAPLAQAVLKSRLFQSLGENLRGPYHRIVAEFLGGRWLARQLDLGVSQRRAYQSLTFAGGVPTALRGIHAWFGHFAPTMTERCIKTDPYGALRYGDVNGLSVPHAKVLLNELGSLAEEDPYFRSEDWGRRAIGGLARLELKDDIIVLLKRPDRHIHLSTLVLEALKASPLALQIVPDLEALLENPAAAYVERYNAGEALAAADVPIDWPATLRRVRNLGDDDSLRLNLELTGHRDPNAFPAEDLADSILQYYGVLTKGPRRSVLGASYMIIKKISPEMAGKLLDQIAVKVEPIKTDRHWRLDFQMGAQVFDLIARALDRSTPGLAEELWRWLKLVEGARGLNEEERAKIAAHLRANEPLRREIQCLAFQDDDIDGGPWIAICMDLPHSSPALSVTSADAIVYMDEIAQKPTLSNFDIELWASLVRYHRGRAGVEPDVAAAALRGVAAHQELAPQWDELKEPPKLDWEERELKRQKKSDRERDKRFKGHRAIFAKEISDIAAGKAFGRLHDMARGYLGQYYDLDREGPPEDRLREWLGDDLLKPALSGFAAALHRDDLPTAARIGEGHAEGRTFNAEIVLIAGVAEQSRVAGSLDGVPLECIRAALAAWNEMPDYFAKQVGVDFGPLLEAKTFSSEEATAAFFEETLAPSIKAGKEHVSQLYSLCREQRFRAVSGALSMKWLSEYPDSHPSVQDDLILAAMSAADRSSFRNLVRQRIAALRNTPGPLCDLWMGASFVVDFEASKSDLKSFAQNNPEAIWAIAGAVRERRSEQWLVLSVPQLEFIVDTFSAQHPPVDHPTGGWSGSENPWDASDFVRGAINSLGSNKTEEASDALARLVAATPPNPYRDQILHVKSAQAKLRRDSEFRIPSFAQAKAILDGSLPQSIDDLKSVVLDALSDAQIYLRTGDTMAWTAFWEEDKPLDENTCRDRLLDVLRWNLPKAIAALPETRMPDEKRVDMAIILQALGLPIEAKGQWHSEVWNAPSDQLIQLYSKDYRAEGRGIYLVFWFGPVPGKNLPKPPGGLEAPNTPQELEAMLVGQLKPDQRERIAAVVIDVSPTK
jgi:hypothetical protein